MEQTQDQTQEQTQDRTQDQTQDQTQEQTQDRTQAQEEDAETKLAAALDVISDMQKTVEELKAAVESAKKENYRLLLMQNNQQSAPDMSGTEALAKMWKGEK